MENLGMGNVDRSDWSGLELEILEFVWETNPDFGSDDVDDLAEEIIRQQSNGVAIPQEYSDWLMGR